MFSGLNKKEARRLAALELLKHEDKERDSALGEFAAFASQLMGVEGCFVTVIDDVFQYVKYAANLPEVAGITPLEETMCKHVFAQSAPVICSDTRNDPRFAHHPLVKDGAVIFYAAAPLRDKEGDMLGTLCVSNRTPLTPSTQQIADFLSIAALASSWLECWNSVGQIDALTALPNRQNLLRAIERIAADEPSGEYTLIIFDCIDMPRAYELSRYLGLSAVENMLKSFATLLQVRLGLRDQSPLYAFATGRYALLVKTDESEAVLRKAANLPPTSAKITGDIEISLNIHAGFIHFVAGQTAVREIFRQAISALHEAIRQNIPLLAFDSAMDQKRNRDFKILYDLGEAIKTDNQLYLVYQPKINLHSGRTEGVEALLRWKHPQLGNIPPTVIISLAERTSLMSDITQWVVATAIKQLVAWRKNHITIPISVNLAASDLSNAGFANALEEKVLQAGLTTADLRVECLETEKVLENSIALEELDMLKMRGFKILLDDFGAGYSNISYLRTIPIDIIKLDRSLICKVTSDRGSQIIARNIIQMLKELDYIVLAEGIEDAETAQLLKGFGCDEAQGYFFSKPLLPEQIPAWLAQNDG
ncbi:histidine kinase [Kosakonia radicincitans]|uniref:EAL domain-containing protein n=1 Tax=Kosakonia TaxID=1330547 RepID=UPI000460F8A3|nr:MULTISPECIES: sensor domain-containing phosphodiesterase [Kosakonia]APG18051.1 histidine kinase [Kosakonia radicincitans]KDE38209.1 histidine kinase [Kosakonia radicincitans UMEnt01/12]PTA92607.1 phosphodiesterase [Kosakonia sp. H7A]